MGNLTKIIRSHTLFPCLVCGVDSAPIRYFLYVFIGGLVLASVLIFLWAKGTGKFQNTDSLNSAAIKAEREDG